MFLLYSFILTSVPIDTYFSFSTYFALRLRHMREDMKLGQNTRYKFPFPTFNFVGKGTVSVRFESLIARQGSRHRAKLFLRNLFVDNIMRISSIICSEPVSYVIQLLICSDDLYKRQIKIYSIIIRTNWRNFQAFESHLNNLTAIRWTKNKLLHPKSDWRMQAWKHRKSQYNHSFLRNSLNTHPRLTNINTIEHVNADVQQCMRSLL
jgi:hypothetical protein